MSNTNTHQYISNIKEF